MSITCTACGTALPEESPGLEPFERLPCPVCGSTARTVSLQVDVGAVAVTGAVATMFVLASLPPAALIGANILSLGGPAAEGQLVVGAGLPWFELAERFKKDPTTLYQLHWRQLEEMVAGAFERAGWDEVILTPRSADKGRDVIATRTGIGSVRIITQVKKYAPNHVVSADEVRSVLGTLQLDHASKAMITTSSRFAPGVAQDERLQPYLPYQLQLLDGEELCKWLGDLWQKR
jgi:restriction system protein